MMDLTKHPRHISDILIYQLVNLKTSKQSLPSAEVATVISFCSKWLLIYQVSLLFRVIS